MVKVCTACKKEKTEEEFYKKSNGKFHSECKKCFNERRMKSYYEKQEKINKYKTESGCYICGYNEHAVCLDLHHYEDTEKENNVSRMVTQNYSWDKIQKEIDKCIVLCAMCHRKLHAGLLNFEYLEV